MMAIFMRFITQTELEVLSEKENTTVTFNGISGQDGTSYWYTVEVFDGRDEYDVYVANTAPAEAEECKLRIRHGAVVCCSNCGKNFNTACDNTYDLYVDGVRADQHSTVEGKTTVVCTKCWQTDAMWANAY